MLEALLVISYVVILVSTFGMYIYQTVLLRRIAKNTEK